MKKLIICIVFLYISLLALALSEKEGIKFVRDYYQLINEYTVAENVKLADRIASMHIGKGYVYPDVEINLGKLTETKGVPIKSVYLVSITSRQNLLLKFIPQDICLESNNNGILIMSYILYVYSGNEQVGKDILKYSVPLKMEIQNKKIKSILKGTRTTPKNNLTVSSDLLSFDADGGSQIISVTSITDWQISVQPASWGHYTKNGNTLTYRVDPNSSSSKRTDWFEIKSGNITKRINITQKAGSITLSLSSYELNFEASGGTKTITITTNGTWYISTDMLSWGHLTKDGNNLKIKLDPNTNSSSRTDYFIIKAGNLERRVNVTQKGDNKPSASIVSITQSHNKPYNMYTTCMTIEVEFETNNLQYKKVYCYAYFYGADNRTPLHDQFFNHISISQSDTAPYENTFFTMTLVMPYLNLNMAPGSHNLTFDIVIKDSSGKVLARQDNNSFQFSSQYPVW